MQRVLVIIPAVFLFMLCKAPGAQTYNIGRVAGEAEVREWAVPVGPAGRQLPPGSGTARQGAVVFSENCAVCHGRVGRGGRYPELNGHLRLYATTTWDFIYRSMPRRQDKPGLRARQLSADETYAVTAYILFLNGVVSEDKVLDADSLPGIVIPLEKVYDH